MAFCKHCNEYIAAHNIATCPLCGNPLPENAPSENVQPENTLPENEVKNPVSDSHSQNLSDSQMPKQPDNAVPPTEPPPTLTLTGTANRGERITRLVASLLVRAIFGYFLIITSVVFVAVFLYGYETGLSSCKRSLLDKTCLLYYKMGFVLIPSLLILDVMLFLPVRVLKKTPLWIKIWLGCALGLVALRGALRIIHGIFS